MRLKERWHLIIDSPVMRIIRNKYLVTTLAFVVWITFFDSNNLIQWSRVVLNISEQESRKSYYRESIKATEEMLNELSSNRDSLEKFARERYLFKEDDEDVFIVEEKR
ncbi:MAG: septum formation inhibitor [Bacteroidales bacterium]|nr:septum formation inhibitor [Bacteroidales bacterium]